MNNARLEFALVQFMLWKCCPEDSSLTPSRKIDLAGTFTFFRLDPSCYATFDVGAKLTNHDFTENFTSRCITET